MKVLRSLPSQSVRKLSTNWKFWARPNQIEPDGKFLNWLILAGRGFGKTRLGAETVRSWAEDKRYERIALVAPTEADARDVMVKGPAGILAISDPEFMPEYNQSHRTITWPNGVVAQHFSAEKPDRLRGPNNSAAWADELASWRNLKYTWDMLQFTLRSGDSPRTIITTTPKPLPLIRKLRAAPETHLTIGSTYENQANVSADWLEQMRKEYDGTRLGRQELHAEILDDVPGALWTPKLFWDYRCEVCPVPLVRVIVAIDPSVTSGAESAEAGIVVAGKGADGHGYLLADLSCRVTPAQWCRVAVNAYHHWKADAIVAEANNGGDMILNLLVTVDGNVRYGKLHASRGKITRAEPIAALYERGIIHHVGDHKQYEKLEDQCENYVPGSMEASPDRMDALVWAFTELFLEAEEDRVVMYEEDYEISRY